MADRYEGKYIDREYVNGQWAGIKAGPMPIAYTGSIQDPDKLRNTSLIIPSSSDGAPSVSGSPSFAVTTIRYGDSAYIQQAIDLTSLNVYLRYYNGTSWGAWVAGNDNTSIDTQIASIKSSITTLSNSLASVRTTANAANTQASTNKNSITSINSKNNTQDTNISNLQTGVASIRSDVSALYSRDNMKVASRWFGLGNIDGTHINNYNAGIISVVQKGYADKMYRQNDDCTAPIVSDSITSNQYCKIFDFTYNCRSVTTSDAAFVWSTTAPLATVLATAEGKTPAKIRICDWPSINKINADGSSWAITGGN